LVAALLDRNECKSSIQPEDQKCRSARESRRPGREFSAKSAVLDQNISSLRAYQGKMDTAFEDLLHPALSQIQGPLNARGVAGCRRSSRNGWTQMREVIYFHQIRKKFGLGTCGTLIVLDSR